MKYKQNIFAVFIVTLSVLIIFFVIEIATGFSMFKIVKRNKYINSIETAHEGELMPSIKLLLADSLTVINTSEIVSNNPVILFYFGPDCPYCQSEMREIIKNIDSLRDVNFYLITPYPFSEMRWFNERFNLNTYSNIKVGRDFAFEFGQYFNTQRIPYLALYDRNKRLYKAFVGNLSYEQIRDIYKD